MRKTSVSPLLLGTSLAWPDGRLTAASVTLVQPKTGMNLLVDTGAWHQRKALLARLNERGIAPTQIDSIILTHLHWDHCVNFDLFAGVPIAVPRGEWDRVQRETIDTATPIYLHELLSAHANITLIEPGEYSGVEIIPTPGHTSGHIAVGVVTTDYSVAIAGDALPTRTAAFSGMPHTWHSDENDAAMSISRLLKDFDVIVPGHDAAFSTGIRDLLLPGPQGPRNERADD